MLDYDWGNPSPIMLTGFDSDDPTRQADQQTRLVFEPYTQQTFSEPLINQTGFNPQTHHYHQQAYDPRAFCSTYDPRAYGSCYPPPQHPAMISFEPASPICPNGFIKSEPGGSSRIGLNLGGRTYFSSSEDDFVNRLYRASRPGESGSVNSPRCQAEGCNADLTDAKHYHRRHKVCEFHSKASTVVAAGLTQRFCQQCSRFHLLSEFDNGKRSCRKRLADHNRRRRKSQRPNHQDLNNKSSSSETTLPRSPPDSVAQSSSSVTAALSPPRISLDCFGQRSYNSTTTSSASTSSLFFSNG